MIKGPYSLVYRLGEQKIKVTLQERMSVKSPFFPHRCKKGRTTEDDVQNLTSQIPLS